MWCSLIQAFEFPPFFNIVVPYPFPLKKDDFAAGIGVTEDEPDIPAYIAYKAFNQKLKFGYEMHVTNFNAVAPPDSKFDLPSQCTTA